MKTTKSIVMLFALLVSAGSAHAVVQLWYVGVDNNFFNVSNWLDDFGPYGGIPDNTTDATMNVGLEAVITDSPTPGVEYLIHKIQIGRFANNLNTLTVNGGNINVTVNIEVGGLWEAGQGTLNINGGAFKGNAVYVGHYDTGIVNVNGGSFEPWGLLKIGGAGGVGTININAGLVKASDLTMVDASQQIIVKDGTLNVTSAWGDTSAKVAGYITSGWIKAAPGYTLHSSTYAAGSGFGTIVTATKNAIPGDITGDGKVDFEDFAVLALHWLEGV